MVNEKHGNSEGWNNRWFWHYVPDVDIQSQEQEQEHAGFWCT